MLVIIVPLNFIYLIVYLWNLIRKNITPKEVGIKISIVLISYVLIGFIHSIQYESVINNANIAVEDIKTYKAKHGTYPKNLSDIKVEEGSGIKRLFYFNEDDKVTLFYRSTLILFDTYEYDFKENKWIFVPD